MTIPNSAQATFTCDDLPQEHPQIIRVFSGDTDLQLGLFGMKLPVLSVCDSGGSIVRPIHNWLSQLRLQIGLSVSLRTAQEYGKSLSYLCRWLEDVQPYPNVGISSSIKLLVRADVTDWLHYMSQKGVNSNTTLHGREVCLKKFLNWLCTHDGGHFRRVEDSPWGGDGTLGYVVNPDPPSSPKFLPTEIIIKLINGMHNECERCMFHTQYDSGLRISELIGLRVKDLPRMEDYDAANEFIPFGVAGAKGRAGKPKNRITLISRAVLNRIKKYHSSLEYVLAENWKLNDPNKPVFLTINNKAWSIRNASKQFKRAVLRQCLDEGFCTHWMRHGTAFSVLRSDLGRDLQDNLLILQQILGHANLSATEIYTQISPEMLIRLNREGRKLNRLVEAEEIRTRTFLGANYHIEKRGHREQ